MSIQSFTVAPQPFHATLVYYYQPGCPFCQEFQPVFLEIAELCKNLSSIHAVAVNVSAHGDVGVPIKTVPTVMYYDIHGQPHKLQANSVEDRTFKKIVRFFLQNLDRDFRTSQQ